MFMDFGIVMLMVVQTPGFDQQSNSTDKTETLKIEYRYII